MTPVLPVPACCTTAEITGEHNWHPSFALQAADGAGYFLTPGCLAGGAAGASAVHDPYGKVHLASVQRAVAAQPEVPAQEGGQTLT